MIAQFYPLMVVACLGIFAAVLIGVSIQDRRHRRS